MKAGNKSIQAIFLSILVVLAASFVVNILRSNPEKTIHAFTKSFRQHDLKTFSNQVDIDLLIVDIADIMDIRPLHADQTLALHDRITDLVVSGIPMTPPSDSPPSDLLLIKMFKPLLTIDNNAPVSIKKLNFRDVNVTAHVLTTGNSEEKIISMQLIKNNDKWRIGKFYNKEQLKNYYAQYQKIKIVDSKTKINRLNITAINQVLETLCAANQINKEKISGYFPSGNILSKATYMNQITGKVLKEYFPDGGISNPLTGKKYWVENGSVVNRD